MIKSRKIWYGLVLLAVVGATAIIIWDFDLGPPWGITQDDVMREAAKDWLLTNRLYQCQDEPWGSEDNPRRIVEEKKQQIWEQYDLEIIKGKVPSVKENYQLLVKINRLNEKALIQIMGKKGFRAFMKQYGESLDAWFKKCYTGVPFSDECKKELEKFMILCSNK